MFGFKVLMGAERVPRDSKDSGIEGSKFGNMIAKVLSFSGAAGRIVFRVKIQNNLFSSKVRQFYEGVVSGITFKIRDFLPQGNSCHSSVER